MTQSEVQTAFEDVWPGQAPQVGIAPPNFRIGRHAGKTSQRMRSAALLTCADHGIFDFSLIVSPSTANLPHPRWGMVFGFFFAGSGQALCTPKTKRVFFFTKHISCSF